VIDHKLAVTVRLFGKRLAELLVAGDQPRGIVLNVDEKNSVVLGSILTVVTVTVVAISVPGSEIPDSREVDRKSPASIKRKMCQRSAQNTLLAALNVLDHTAKFSVSVIIVNDAFIVKPLKQAALLKIPRAALANLVKFPILKCYVTDLGNIVVGRESVVKPYSVRKMPLRLLVIRLKIVISKKIVKSVIRTYGLDIYY
jgi:hypothetical protein